ncbi:unnamed protein product [Durusdinium trenchii]|uniref:PH domain-containing protein n=1 Tax=Durusdinium trenchii TaxID=1381693 RepID=A0ABP0LRQ2_9DINO
MDPQEAQDARVSRQGRYSAWLKKAKSENARCKLLQSHNTRYFTIDFDSQIIFYSHSTSQKKVSQPIPFRDILGAERLPLPTKSRKGRNAMIFGFILKTKQRTFELFTNSNADAAQWTFSLNAAMEMGKQKMEQLKVLQAQAEVPVRNQDDTPQKAALPTGTRTAAASEEEKETPRRPRQVEAPPAAVLEQEEEALVPPHLLKAEEQAAEKKKEEELAAKKKEEAEAAAKKQEEEAAARKKQVEEQEALRKKEEEAAARKKQEEEAAARKKQDEEAAARKKQEEEAARKKQEEEAAAKKQQEEEAAARAMQEAARKEAASPEGEPSIEALEDLADLKAGVKDLLQDAFEQGSLVEALSIFLAQDVHEDAGEASEWQEMMRMEDAQKAKSKKSDGKHEKREKKRQKEEVGTAESKDQKTDEKDLPPLKPRLKLAPLVVPGGAPNDEPASGG